MKTATETKHRVLIYHHNPEYVETYEKLLRNRKKNLTVFPCKSMDQVDRIIQDVNIIFSGHTFPLDRIVRAKKLKWIQSMSAGVENYMKSGAIPDHVIVTKIEGLFGPIMSEYILGHILAITQNMRRVFDNQNRKTWEPFLVDSIRSKTVGIMGLGSIGAYVGFQLHKLGVKVTGFDEQIKKLPYMDQEYTLSEILEFLREPDFIVVTLPLTNVTEGILGTDELSNMKRSAYLINISRGPIVKEKDLLEALRSGRIAGAILDVFDQEPLPSGHEFWQLPNVILTPHVSGPSIPQDIVEFFLENLEKYDNDQKMKGLVDKSRGY